MNRITWKRGHTLPSRQLGYFVVRPNGKSEVHLPMVNFYEALFSRPHSGRKKSMPGSSTCWRLERKRFLSAVPKKAGKATKMYQTCFVKRLCRSGGPNHRRASHMHTVEKLMQLHTVFFPIPSSSKQECLTCHQPQHWVSSSRKWHKSLEFHVRQGARQTHKHFVSLPFCMGMSPQRFDLFMTHAFKIKSDSQLLIMARNMNEFLEGAFGSRGHAN